MAVLEAARVRAGSTYQVSSLSLSRVSCAILKRAGAQLEASLRYSRIPDSSRDVGKSRCRAKRKGAVASMSTSDGGGQVWPMVTLTRGNCIPDLTKDSSSFGSSMNTSWQRSACWRVWQGADWRRNGRLRPRDSQLLVKKEAGSWP